MTLKAVHESLVLSRDRVFPLRQAFQNLMRYKGEKFSAFVSKNANKLDSLIKGFNKKIDDMKPRGEVIEAYLKAEEEILKNFANKDKNGKPIMVGAGQYDIPAELNDEVQEAITGVREGHKDAWTQIQDFTKERNEYMQGEIEVEMHKIYSSNLPEDITGGDRYPVEDYIIDTGNVAQE